MRAPFGQRFLYSKEPSVGQKSPSPNLLLKPILFHPTEVALRSPFYFAVLKHHPHLGNSEVAGDATEVALRFPEEKQHSMFVLTYYLYG